LIQQPHDSFFVEYEVEWDNNLCFIMLRVKGYIKIRILDKKHRRAWDSHMMEEQNTTEAVSKNKKERNQTSNSSGSYNPPRKQKLQTSINFFDFLSPILISYLTWKRLSLSLSLSLSLLCLQLSFHKYLWREQLNISFQSSYNYNIFLVISALLVSALVYMYPFEVVVSFFSC